MIYKLDFDTRALKEWRRLDATIREQFRKKLAKRLEHPRVPHDALSGEPDCYKIKLRSAGFRLVYKVEDDVLVVFVIAIGKREGGAVYDEARDRSH